NYIEEEALTELVKRSRGTPRIDETIVHKRLERARPTDASAVMKELAKFKTNLLQMLAAPIPALEVAPVGGEAFFGLTNCPNTHGKRPLENDDA
ncbi:MAG: hypothetical protein Q8830_03045, partial [Candidatus Phytoplasma australasiaticum]|nr:hypothetical protein [Candidatus Phytoplasma australasiaticum]